MKLKHVLASLTLASVMGFAALAGLNAREARQAKADDPKTWMSSFAVNIEDTAEWPGDIVDIQVHLIGNDVDNWVYLHQMGLPYVWTSSYSFTDAQTVTSVEFGFNQQQGESKSWKQSTRLNNVAFTKASHCQLLFVDFDNTKWGENEDAGKWVIDNGDVSDFKYEFGKSGESQVYDMLEDPENGRFVSAKLEVNEAGTFNFGLRINGNWNYNSFVNRESELKKYASSYGTNYFAFKEAGDYYVYLSNEYYDDGIVSIRKDGAAEESYVYYVTNSASATNDYIYTFGDGVVQAEQFGAFPGTKITSVEGVQEVTGNGVLHFQGSEEAKLIYKIPVEVGGYPTGDYRIQINNGTSEYKTANMLLVAGSAYWWSNEVDYHNDDAGLALDLLVKVEAARNAIKDKDGYKDYSVCGIDADVCGNLYDEYAALSASIRTTYVDSSKVLTYKVDKSEGNELVSYAAIMARLAAQGGRTPVSPFKYANNVSETKTIVIVMISVFATLAAAGSILILKKKHE